MFDSGTISSTLSWWTPPRLASVWLQSSFWWMPRSLRRFLICKKCIASPHLSTNMTRIGFDFWGAAYSNSQELMAYHFVALRMFAFSDLSGVQLSSQFFSGRRCGCRGLYFSSPDFDQSHPSPSQKVRYLKFIGDFKELVARLTGRTGRGIAMGCETSTRILCNV